jgi:hypothetical protein
VILVAVSECWFGSSHGQVMAGRGSRGAMLEALLAQQQRPCTQDGSQAEKSPVRKYITKSGCFLKSTFISHIAFRTRLSNSGTHCFEPPCRAYKHSVFNCRHYLTQEFY